MHGATLQAARIARLTIRLLKPAAAAAVLAVLLRLVLGPGALGYDAGYALVYGQDLLSPDYGARFPPTPHPLASLAGFAASLFGDAAPGLLLALSFGAFAVLGVAAFAVGRRTFGTLAGVAFAALLLTRPLLVTGTLQASVDVPFLALVLAALAVALGEGPDRDARPRAVLVLLTLAGLLRPEAWLLALAYAAYVRRHVALALLAPVLWSAFDLVTTGDPLHSLTGTQDLAVQLERERGLASAFDVLPASLETILVAGVLWAGLAVGVVALATAQERAQVPVAVLVLGLLGFLALGVFDLPLLVRYLLVPAAMLALLCAAGLAAPAWLRPRAAGAAASVAVAAVLAATAPGTYDDVDAVKRSVAFGRDVDRSLLAVADRVPEGCGPVQLATDRAVPVLAYRLGIDPSDIVVAPATRDRGLLFAARADVAGTDIDFDRGAQAAADVPLPPGFTPVAEDEWWTLGARC